MDPSRRRITKIAREISKFTVRTLRADGIGTAELDTIHVVRKNPGVTQAEICKTLGTDKAVMARRISRLEAKGYIERRANPADARSKLLFPLPAAQGLKDSKAEIEAACYEWLLDGLSDDDRAEFCRLVDVVYARSKEESKAGFPHYKAIIEDKAIIEEKANGDGQRG